ncbi:MAG TPA: nuclear transport factor 2 family protein, partial [Solirubrobacteraceae bacterium]|nr:nuclear transport factor 2 family protein [Solirubrobacteraceae bacterium]
GLLCEAVSVNARQEVIRAAEARALALANADSKALWDLLHEEFRWTSHTGEAFTRSDYIERNTAGSVAWRSQRLVGIDLTVVGDVAVLRAELTDEIISQDGSELFGMPMTQVWVRQGDRWRCLAGHAGPRRT